MISGFDLNDLNIIKEIKEAFEIIYEKSDS